MKPIRQIRNPGSKILKLLENFILKAFFIQFIIVILRYINEANNNGRIKKIFTYRKR
jgi:hypothetical protein